MKKDSCYFSHDSDATDDPKIMVMIAEWGLEAYGMYWVLIEHLRKQPDFKSNLLILKALAVRFNSSEEKLKAIINRYGLFCVEDSIFYSDSLIRRMKPMQDKREHMKQLADRSWVVRRQSEGKRARKAHAHAYAMQSKVKKSKVKESKEEEENNTIHKNIPDLGKRVEIRDANGKGFAPTTPSFLPLAENFKQLPERVSTDLIKMVSTVKQVEIEKEDVNTIWEVFINHNLTGEKPYANDQDVYRHFTNWGMKQSFRKKSKPKEKKINGENVGVEFLDDFTKCKMKNGDIIDLIRNESDLARYGHLSPHNVKR